MSIYKDYIIPGLREKYGQERFLCVIGNQQIGSPATYDAIETFKMQNSELFKHFVKQIRQSDIVIADLTDNNPNVHVELGIALSYNKNSLRVTRSSYEKLPFDVRNYEIVQYCLKQDLIELEGDRIKANIDAIHLECGDLDIQSPGQVQFASWFTTTKFWDAQIVCRDTIETFDTFG